MDRKQIQERMKALLNSAEAEKRDFSEAEEIEYCGLEAKLNQLEFAEKQSQRSKRSIPLSAAQRGEGGDYQKAVLGKVGARYEELFPEMRASGVDVNRAFIDFFEKRTILSGTGSTGGFVMPTEMWRSVYNSVSRDGIFLGRMTVFPMAANSQTIPALDSEDQTQGFIGNIVARIVAEGVTENPVTPLFRDMTLKALKWIIYMNASHESLADSGGRIDGVVGPIIKLGVQQTVDEQVLTGNGVNAPLGILHSDAAISIPRNTVDSVAYVDCVKMLARIHPVFQAGAIWVVSNEAFEKMMLMQDPGSHYVWNVSSTAGADKPVPGTLLGKPVFVSDSCSALGDRGDVVLVDPRAIAFGLREDFIMESSNSPEWYKHLMSFRGFMRADCQPLIGRPITPRNGASTLSFATVLE
jgi:HK97 family phage major capsid protein